MLVAINDDLLNQAIYKTGLDAKTVLEKALKLLLTAEQPQTLAKFPDLTEFWHEIRLNQEILLRFAVALR